ncbi:MAG: hypothetical protein IT438_03615 [Phycisphaerales bacterium]|nr:hypothetical protein [Phycisphaerales bacterium]
MPHGRHAPRPKFDTLFADRRHYRGDLRLMRTAIRRGWLNDAPQADRDALMARLRQATAARQADDPKNFRGILGECRAVIEAERSNQRADGRAWQAAWFGDRARVGRPRDRWHVSDYPHRIDANAVRRRAMAEGIDLRNL